MAQCGNVGKAQRTKVSGGFNGLIILRGAQFMKSFDTGCSQTEVIAVVVAGEGTGSMKPDGNRVKLFVSLLAEGADVWRPTEAVPIGDGLFKILSTPNYDPEDEVWEFPPGAIVRCETRQDNSGKYIVAVKP